MVSRAPVPLGSTNPRFARRQELEVERPDCARRPDFHLDGKFTHCGTDIFTLVKTADGWKISGGIYTVEPTGCEPSPLGAIK